MAPWTPDKTAQLKAAFGDREFTGTEMANVLGLKSHHGTGGIFMRLEKDHIVERTRRGYRFTNGVTPPANQPISAVLEQSAPTIIKVHGYYINPSAILIVDTLQSDKVVIHTSILEIDGETKHPRNKRLIFTRQHAPDEYAAIIGWLSAHSETPPSALEDTQAALQLAEEASARPKDAQEEIESLKAKIAQFRALLGDA